MVTLGIREIFIFLFVTIIVGTIGATANVYTNYQIMSRQDALLRDLVHHAHESDAHTNATDTTLELIQQSQARQAPLLEKIETHINQTATAAPIVAENNKLLTQLFEEFSNSNSSRSQLN